MLRWLRYAVTNIAEALALVSQKQVPNKSRREWMLNRFEYAGKFQKRITKYKFWQDGNHAEVIFSKKFFYQKLNYIHKNYKALV